MRNLVLVMFIVFTIVFMITCELENSDNVAISIAAGKQSNPRIVSDGKGGGIITWEDNRDSSTDIYAQRFSADGSVLWTVNGIVISDSTYAQSYPEIISDDNGGAIITWVDFFNSSANIFAQRINADGKILWTANGVAISTAEGTLSNPKLTSDENNGAIITWVHSHFLGSDIYAQRIDAAGNVLWTANGVALSTAEKSHYEPEITGDGNGGAIVIWHNTDIYAQRINADGMTLWTTNGVAINTSTDIILLPQLVSDGNGGAIMTWTDSKIHAQRINAEGRVLWPVNGVSISTAEGIQLTPRIEKDDSGGAIITWMNENKDFAVFAQRINAVGTVLWTMSGVAISTTKSPYFPNITRDGIGGAIITWVDSSIDTGEDIYAQRIDADGKRLWANGVAVSTAKSSQWRSKVTSNGKGGAIFTWEDYRNGTGMSDIFAQRISANGN